MDSERWERVQELFHDAAALPDSERRAFLESACGDDPSLVNDTLSLLVEDARGGSVLDRGVASVAEKVLGSDVPFSPSTHQFGPYRLVRVLGEGGMGVVYLAERDDLQTRAAVKFLRDAWLSPARRERFTSEQRTLAQLNHPKIARLYDAGTLRDDTPWFVMEYVEGVPLTEYCRRHSLGIAARLRLFRDVCEAVQHAHRHLIVHRDLKPSNILVASDGAVKLLDFGIAKQLESLDVATDQTRTGVPLMTPAYAAPEQVRAGRIGTHTDIYSLGVILYELVVGRLPFDFSERTPKEIDIIITEEEPRRPSLAAREAREARESATASPSAASPDAGAASSGEWADLDVLCLTAMQKDPQRRYHSVDALMRDIDHFLAGEPLEARADRTGYRMGKFVRRNRRSVGAAALAVAAGIALVVFYTVRLARARDAAVAQAARTERIQRFMLDLFNGGDKSVGPADSLHVVTLVDRGLREARSLTAEPAVQAELDLTLGGIYQKMGLFARADSLFGAGVDTRRSLYGPNHPDVAAGLVALGLLRIDQGKFDEAEALARQAVAIDERALPANHPELASANVALGRALEERGRYPEAISVLERAVRSYASSAAPTADRASSVSALADAHYYAGHYEISDSLNLRALATYRRLYGERHPSVANILINLGASQYDRGSYKEAEGFDRQALSIMEGFYGPDHYETAATLTMLGRALLSEQRFDEADSVLHRALAIRERVYGDAHPLVASTLNELANIEMGRDRYAEAEPYYRRMLTIYHAAYGDQHYLIALATSNLGTAALLQKRYAEAEGLFRDAIARYTATQGPNHINTGIARIKLGRTLLRERRFAEARVETAAGYDVLRGQATSSYGFLQNARKDLSIELDSLGKPDSAAHYRAESAAEERKANAAAAKK
ncbi:MAG: tetratricopeptide repeat protein [Gemmatimonadales bacterium]